MRIPERLRDPVALIETSVFGVGGAVVGVLGPSPWFGFAGLVIAAVVLTITTWRKHESGSDREHPPDDVTGERVKQWARNATDDDAVRGRANDAVVLAGEIEDLTLRCENKITKMPEGVKRELVEINVRNAVNFVKKHTRNEPETQVDWYTLVKHLKQAKEMLSDELDNLRPDSD